MQEQTTLTGHWRLVLRGPDGEVKAERQGHNIITNAGKNDAIERIMNATGTPAVFNYIGIGTNNTAEGAGDTALGTEIGTRVQDTAATPDPPTTTGQQQLVATFGAGNGTGTIVEAGVFNASSGGTMLNRKTFGAITKGATDTLDVTVTLTLS